MIVQASLIHREQPHKVTAQTNINAFTKTYFLTNEASTKLLFLFFIEAYFLSPLRALLTFTQPNLTIPYE